MAWNGSGTFTRTNGDNTGSGLWQQDAADGDNIEADRHDTHDQDLATGIQACLCKNGENAPSADLPMGTHKHTGVGNGSARTHYAALGQVQDSTPMWGGTAGGSANARTISLTPAITAYAAGQRFAFKNGANSNTAAITLAVNGLAAKKIMRGSTPDELASGDLKESQVYEVVYDGTQFILMGAPYKPITGTYSAAGTSQAGATAITNLGFAYVNTVSGSAYCVKLPTGTAGDEVTVMNGTNTTTIRVYPPSTGTINGSSSIWLNVLPYAAAHFRCYQALGWSGVGEKDAA